MTPNPYQPPNPYRGAPPVAVVNRTPFVLAGIGAWLASLYWAALALLNSLFAAVGAGSGVTVVMPLILIVLYAVRGFQVLQGDPAAARRLLWLHAIGALAALLLAFSSSGFYAGLQSVKVLIGIFGAVTAFRAQRAVAQSTVPRR
jgi:hypothetical protein